MHLISKINVNQNSLIMKLLYTLLFVFGAMLAGYLFLNDFNFDNTTFSNYLINTLFVLLLSSLVIGGILYLISIKRKNAYKDIMTIRQYYQYKSAR